jgi:secondary thiamine-phosphate synthase enzyme
MLTTFTVSTRAREELIDITAEVRRAIAAAGFRSGIAVVQSAHTTAAVTVNENADPDVGRDILHWLRSRIPQHEKEFRHNEGNSDSHLKTSLFGAAQTLIVDEGRLVLGTWQGIFLAEFDGPRTRKIHVKLIAG